MPRAKSGDKPKVDLVDLLSSPVPAATGVDRIVHWDNVQRGLGLRVTSKGKTTFVVMRRLPKGKLVNHAIGEPSWMSVDEAREEARKVLGTLKAGRTPKEVEAEERRAEEERRRHEEDERRRREAHDFSNVAEFFIVEHLPRLRGARGCEAMVRRELIPRWRGRPAGEVDMDDVVAMVSDVRGRRGVSAARKAFAQASRVFSWALSNRKGGVRLNPCTGVKIGDVVGSIKPRDRDLNAREVRAVWSAAEDIGYPFGTLYRFLLLTGCRLNELAAARWDEVDADTLTVPAERMKGRLSHVVPLTPLALKILDTVPSFKGPHMFTTTGGARPVSGYSKAKVRLERLLNGKVAPFVIHDFRRTVRTGLSSLRVPEHVSERVLAHVEGRLRRTYNRYDYLDEKREALLAWEARLRAIVGEAPPGASEAPRPADAAE